MDFTYPPTCSKQFRGILKVSVRYALPLAMALSASTGHCDTLPDTLSLSRGMAIEMAIRKNIDLRVESLNYSMAETDVDRSWGIYNPILVVSGTGGVTSVPGDPFFSSRYSTGSIGLTQYLPTGGYFSASTQSGYTNAEVSNPDSSTSTWQSTAGLALSQPLLKNAGKQTMELSITLAANALEDSRERYRFTTTDTVLAVITAYNHLYTLRQTLETKRGALKSAQDFLEELRKRPKPTALQKIELANTEYTIAQRLKDLVEAERSVSDQEANLRYLIGMEQKTRIIPVDPPPREEPQTTEDQAVKSALEYRSDLKQLRITLKSSQLQERVADHQTLPELTVSGSGGLTGTGTNFAESYRKVAQKPGTYWSAGMQLNVPLGNTAAYNDYLKNKIRTEQVQNQIDALVWKIRNDVEADMRALISARLQIQTTEKALQYAEQRHDEYRNQTRAGATTVQDFINAENDLIAARNAHQDSTEAFAYAVSKLWRDTGELLDHQGVRITSPDQLKSNK
ncbi:outer membrane efflux protein [Geobacter metallireducens RCH3]|uniref:Efflux pump, RND family, outer membrane protein n=1 Tax=Geobacter metallireducens (strain ATCC 53774 / DSM 7210 / GS-15) TaxID=269799 RepID=Q39WE7_GEOMG|nr:TolC family protein [Geobacter metallireducens]ABB31427.1 efflux pump, RND family, outer membrane protein [Geobacter metallireducens GS-15]EHP88487.1 outer membrane efflux protein [Geobacter metallireducens RCH3]